MPADQGVPKALQALLKRAPPLRRPGALGKVGRYQLLEAVGEGGHGRVYRAMDTATSKVVAIKVLHESVKSPELELRMKREAYAMGRLAGTSATEVYECAVAESGQLYLAMEYLEGQGLDKLIAEYEARGERFPIAKMFEVLAPVVDTLELAHARGIIHRDLKPENIFIKKDGGVRLVDFGLMKDLSLAKLTDAGVVAGSPSYIAPEGWAGVPEALDHRIDVYALGVIVFRILTGKKPFEQDGTMLDFVLLVTKGPRPSIAASRRDLPAAVDDWARRALAVRPDHRWESAKALFDALARILPPPSSPR
jgi:serine/threonine protein kinase